MKDRTRHSLAVLLFLVFGPTLTVALIGWITLRRSPLAVQAEINVIRAETGTDLNIDSVEYLRWNFWKYGQLELPHPNTGQALVVFSDLENRVFRTEVSRSGSLVSFLLPKELGAESFRRLNSPVVSVHLNPRAVSEDIAILSRLLLNQFGDRFSSRKPNLAFHFNEMEIRCPESLFQLRFVEGHFRSDEGTCLLKCTFSMLENPSQDPIHFTILRPKNGSPEEPELLVELRTEETPVPVRFLALLFPGLNSLGPKAFFHGTVRGELKRNTWVVTFEDMSIENADLKTLGAALTPYRLSGQVQIGLYSARIVMSGNQTRFWDAAGWIGITNGSIERTLLAGLVEDWQLSPTPNDVTNPLHQNDFDLLERVPKEQQDIPFTEATFRVFLRKDGVWLRPEESAKESGLVIKMDSHNIAKYHLPEQISSHWISYSALFDSFSPVNTELVPLTPQIQRIVPYLLLP